MTPPDLAAFAADRETLRAMLARWDSVVAQIRDPEERRYLLDAYQALDDAAFYLRFALTVRAPLVYATVAGADLDAEGTQP